MEQVPILGNSGALLKAEQNRGVRCNSCGLVMDDGTEFIRIDVVETDQGTVARTGSAFICGRESCAVRTAEMKSSCTAWRPTVGWVIPGEQTDE